MSQNKRRSRRPARSEHRRILIVTEGPVTEKQYLERLHQTLRGGAVAVSVKTVGVGKDPRAVVKKCLELRDLAATAGKSYDQCICVVDVDEHSTLEQAASLCQSEDISLIVTNLKFEVWLLWHIADSRSVQSSQQLDRLMERHKLLKGEY